MWGSASADRSLIETQDTVLWLRLHLGGDASRLGLGCWTAVHPALSGSGRESPTCFGRPCTPGPDVPDGFGRIGAPSRGFPDACFGRHRIPARNARTCFGRHRRSARNARTCFGRHRRSVESPSRFGGPGIRTPPPGFGFGRHRTKAGGHEAPASRSKHRPPRWTSARSPGSASTGFGEWRFRTGFGRCGRYPRGFRRPRPPATVTPVTARPRGSPTASAAGGPLPPFFSGRGAAREETAQAVLSRRRTPTNLFATPFEVPGNRVGETGRMDGNGREATTAAMRNGC
jgi:hypothetical protein